MSMEISSVVGRMSGASRDAAGKLAADVLPQDRSSGSGQTTRQVELSANLDLDKVAQDLAMVTQTFNRRLKFAVNEELGQVVVKVIDSQTDKVIKELPPQALQRLHIRIREAIGLLIDEEI